MLFDCENDLKNTRKNEASRLRHGLLLPALFACALLLAFSACGISRSAAVPESPTPAASPSDVALPSPSPTLSPSPSPAPTPTAEPTPESGASTLRASFLGILGFGGVTADEVKKDGARVYRFLADGDEILLAIQGDADFAIQNTLFEGYEYELTLDESGIVIGAEFAFELDDGEAHPVSYVPGERTLKNLLAAAMQPLGHTLYVYGGGWNWQDDGASMLSRRIGRPRTWRDFFISQTADYSYKDEASPETSYYPFGGWCEYFYAGLDCSGYLGRALYCTLETEDGRAGYVFKSTDFAKTLADMNLGSFSAEKLENGGTALQSGDIVSFKGHTYLVLGRCDDGSFVILHSSPTPSRTNCRGGGVQLSAIDPSGNGGGMALSLIKRYTEKYFPEWYARYENIAVPYSTYIDFERSGNAGFFRWNIGKDGALSDPDGILNMSAEDILKELFGE